MRARLRLRLRRLRLPERAAARREYLLSRQLHHGRELSGVLLLSLWNENYVQLPHHSGRPRPGELLGYFCHTHADECSDDKDCKGAEAACVFKGDTRDT